MAEVYDAIKAFLQDSGNVAGLADPTTHTVPPFRFENEEFEKIEPAATASFIAVALTGTLYGQQSIGAASQATNRWDEQGHLWLPVFVPMNTGSSRAREIAKLLCNLFRGRALMNGDLEFMDSFIGEGQPAPEEGNWYQLSVSIEWRRVEA